MKSLLQKIFIFLFSVGMFSCSKIKDLNSSPKDLMLVSPSGDSIASNYTALLNIANNAVSLSTNNDSIIRIDSISYFDVKEGLASLVYYTTRKDKAGALGITTVDSRIHIDQANLTVKELPSSLSFGVEQVSENNPQKIATISYAGKKTSLLNTLNEAPPVKVTITCTGTCDCRVQGTVDLNTGIMTYGCSCSNCTATVTTTSPTPQP